MSVPTKSVRNLAVDLATADNHDFASNDERFNSIFSMLDKDGNVSLKIISRNQAAPFRSSSGRSVLSTRPCSS